MKPASLKKDSNTTPVEFVTGETLIVKTIWENSLKEKLTLERQEFFLETIKIGYEEQTMGEQSKMVETRTVKRDQTAWNIAVHHSNLVGSLLVSAWKKFEIGDLIEWFWKFNLLREVVGHDLTPNEVKDLDGREERIFKMISFGKIKNGQRKQFKQEVLYYSRAIHKILKAQGYFPTKEDRTKLSF